MDAACPASRSHGNWIPAYMDVAYPLSSPQTTLPYSCVDLPIAVTEQFQPELDEDLGGGHDSSLEYINSILMDETFEDSSWHLLAHIAGGLTDTSGFANEVTGEATSLDDRYERIYKGFHEILDENIESVEDRSKSSYEYLMADEIPQAGLCYNKFSPSLYLHVQEEDGSINAFGDGVGLAHMAQVFNIESQQTDHLTAGPATQQLYGRQKDPLPSARSHPARGAEDISLVQNADLPAELYAQLFDEFPLYQGKEAALSRVVNGDHREGRSDEALENPVDLKALLLSSSKALGNGNVKQAMDYLQQIRQEGASPHGSGLQRVVHYFSEALMARLSGMGNMLYKTMAGTAQLPSPLMMIKTFRRMFEVCPYVKVSYYFANQHILKAARGASRLHIIDYGILYGFQWPCLIYTLAHRQGGPPFLRITGIEFPASPADRNPTATTDGTSKRLREYARTYNVPFEYHAISSSRWEDVDAASLRISQDELLVINSFNRLGHIHDETLMHPSPRDQLLMRMQSLNPNLLVMGSMNAAHSTPFFAPRFREAFYYYYNIFDMLHTTTVNDSPERELFERELMGRSILNVVACEGVERLELPETYKQWQARVTRAGFRQLSIIPSVLHKTKTIMMDYHKDFSLLQDSKWLLVGWRGRSIQAISAWKPSRQ